MKAYRFCSYHKYHRLDATVRQLRNKRIFMRDWGRMGEHYREHLDPNKKFRLFVVTVAYTHDGHIIGACISDLDVDHTRAWVTYNTYVRKAYRKRGVGSHLAKLCHRKSSEMVKTIGDFEEVYHVADTTNYADDEFWKRVGITA